MKIVIGSESLRSTVFLHVVVLNYSSFLAMR